MQNMYIQSTRQSKIKGKRKNHAKNKMRRKLDPARFGEKEKECKTVTTFGCAKLSPKRFSISPSPS
jgi:hypothetical protein